MDSEKSSQMLSSKAVTTCDACSCFVYPVWRLNVWGRLWGMPECMNHLPDRFSNSTCHQIMGQAHGDALPKQYPEHND